MAERDFTVSMTLQNIQVEDGLNVSGVPVPSLPLVVELEGGLVDATIGLELLAAHLSTGNVKAVLAHLRGNTGQSGIATVAATLPFRGETRIVMENAAAAGRPVYLIARETLLPLARLLSSRLGTVTDVVSHETLANGLPGRSGFDYVGAATNDGPLWQQARRAYVLGLSRVQARRFERDGINVLALSGPVPRWRALIRLLRPHQYAKNLLVFVPMVTSHQLHVQSLLTCLLAFLCFSLAASAVYVLNDFVDLHADRGHPTKKSRPFAATTVSLRTGLLLMPALLLAAAVMTTRLPATFSLLLACYILITTAYSFSLKKMMLVDVTVLALLYTMRVVAGAAAISVDLSEWLFAFSLMIFTALALTKRYVELSERKARDLPDPGNRDYRISDLPIIAALAAAAGMNAITVLALYVNSDNVKRLYQHPAVLWMLCPLFLYWIGRVLLLAHRRQLHDDPIVFALKDVRSWLVGACTMTIVALAM